jgi:NTP pyrophosphatase (non-canonical NTP hydrolase)
MRNCTFLNKHHVECCTECGLGIDFCQCVDYDGSAENRLTSADGLVFKMIRDELVAAREAFPGKTHMLCATMEEVGELAQAMMQHDRHEGTSAQEILREAVQVAAMAIRIAVEGDDNFLYEFPAVEDELPRGPVGGQYQ